MSFSEWKVITFQESGLEIEDGDRGKNYPNKSQLLREGYCPFLNNKNIAGDKLNFEETDFITKEKDQLLRKGKAYRGDIILTTRGSVGNVALFDETIGYEFIRINSGMVIIRNNDLFDLKFLYQQLKSPYMKTQYKNMSTGSAQPQLPIRDIRKLELLLPPLQEQKSIAHILSTLDDKIEVNNQINKTLENMAQATFKQWFVDFEFPNEDGEPYKSSGGEMVESELGMIPKGWEVRRIGDECFCSLGGTPSRQKSDYWNGDIPWVNSGEVNNFRIYKPSEYITKLGLEKSATKLLKKKTTVLAITGATLGQVSLLEIDTCTNQSVVGISENDKISHVYIYPYVKSVIKKIIGNQTGGAQQHINKGNVEDTKLLIPNKKVLNAYTKLVRPQYDLISSICFENELLTRLRDSLIPKLMSGEIRVPINNN